MDPFYNREDARKLLESVAKKRVILGAIDSQLLFYTEDNGASQIATPVHFNRPQLWRLVAKNTEESEELVFRIQGIICQKDLPPMTRPIKMDRERQYIKQGLSLTGFGAVYFDACVKNIQEIHHEFSRMLPDGSMEDWIPSLLNEESCIDMGNRYFTNRHNMNGESVPIPFKSSVDPNQYLARALGNDYIHTAENEVEYLEAYFDNNGRQRYKRVDPVKLRTGDIVEVQVSFVAAPIKDKRYRLITILRAITLLNMQPSRDAEMARQQNQMQKTVICPTLKRKVGYSDDENEEIRHKITRMTLE